MERHNHLWFSTTMKGNCLSMSGNNGCYMRTCNNLPNMSMKEAAVAVLGLLPQMLVLCAQLVIDSCGKSCFIKKYKHVWLNQEDASVQRKMYSTVSVWSDPIYPFEYNMHYVFMLHHSLPVDLRITIFLISSWECAYIEIMNQNCAFSLASSDMHKKGCLPNTTNGGRSSMRCKCIVRSAGHRHFTVINIYTLTVAYSTSAIFFL